MTTLRPFFSYFGGKWRTAKHYPAPRQDLIVEPFAGSAGYSVRHPHKAVILNDLDPVVCGTWDYLIRAPEEEILSLPEWDGTWATTDDIKIPQEARWLIGWWINKGSSRPGKTPTTWMRSVPPTGENFWGAGIKARIARQQQFIRHWIVTSKDYSDLPNLDATWFIDPPYQEAGKEYKHGASGIDFSELGAWCSSRNGQAIVCENKGAEWLPVRDFRDIKASPGARRTGVSKEVIWTNESEDIA